MSDTSAVRAATVTGVPSATRPHLRISCPTARQGRSSQQGAADDGLRILAIRVIGHCFIRNGYAVCYFKGHKPLFTMGRIGHE